MMIVSSWNIARTNSRGERFEGDPYQSCSPFRVALHVKNPTLMLIPPKSLISRNLALCDEGRIPSSNTVKKIYIKNTYQSFLHCFSTVLEFNILHSGLGRGIDRHPVNQTEHWLSWTKPQHIPNRTSRGTNTQAEGLHPKQRLQSTPRFIAGTIEHGSKKLVKKIHLLSHTSGLVCDAVNYKHITQALCLWIDKAISANKDWKWLRTYILDPPNSLSNNFLFPE